MEASSPSRIRRVLPHGGTLPRDVWLRRHHALVGLLVIQAVGLIVFALEEGNTLLHSLAEAAIVAPVAIAAIALEKRQRLASMLVAAGLITECGLLVHIWNGVIEAHFMFFVMILVLALYEDWLPFLVAIAYVVAHHGIAGTVDPSGVYNHPDAIAHPWKWAAIHGAFVTAAAIASIMAWRLNESLRVEKQAAFRRAHESEQRFRGAFADAPIGMALASIGDDPGRFLQVNRAMCEFTGRSEEELVGMNFGEISHPDDLGKSREAFGKLVRGEVDRYRFEKRYIHKASGGTRWGALSVSLIHGDDGSPQYAIGQIEDVTERRRATEQLARQAYSDSLTTLRNRRGLTVDLEERIKQASPDAPLPLIIFDLDGFKAYNDTFGHPAGDSLLSRIGKRLGAVVGDGADAYRMGGDEFCVLGTAGGPSAEELLPVALEALDERGKGFRVTASAGCVMVPADATDPDSALRIADQRMYAQKDTGRVSAGRQSADVLLKTLSERNPALGVHLDEVTTLCDRVARRLGLTDEEVAPLLQAASLHDVGKAAIPDAILNKSDEPDEAEWDLLRQHTLIGERILAAAPALTKAAKLVRWSHERWEGGGYPDSLVGEEIPLGARIISVCDSYDAMVSDRPYRARMTHDDALDELRRCSGTQFDPEVVSCFIAEVTPRESNVSRATA